MARQVEGTLAAIERTGEQPALTASAMNKSEAGGTAFRAETADALDRSIEALRETLELAETRWHRLESRLADQDRAIRELRARDIRASRVPELTEIVKSVAAVPEAAAGSPSALAGRATADADQAALLDRIAALEAFIAGQNDHLEAVEAELVNSRQRIAELESPGSPES